MIKKILIVLFSITREFSTTNAEYDFIIIGSGSAGSVIASRLSEIPHWKILLLEAGSKPKAFNKIPLAAPIYQMINEYNWNYTMEKQENFCLAMENQQCAWPRGKSLGGSTILNYMIYSRGSAEDYNKWGKEHEGWSYQDVLPYFLKSEDCQLDSGCDTDYHNTGGLLTVSESFSSELADYFIAAGNNLGYNQIDYNTDDQKIQGFSKMQATIRHGRREDVYTAFINGFSDRENLKIIDNAKVMQILIDPRKKQAYGVKYEKNGHIFTVNASKEIVLSAGAINSPQLLMLSGIGPRKDLHELGISPIIQNLPVGRELHDHIAFMGMIYVINKQVEPFSKFFDPRSALNWFIRGKGFWTSLGGIEAIAFLENNKIELLLNGIGSLQFDKGRFSRPELRITQQFYDEYFKPLENLGVFSIMPVLLHPKSIGNLKLQSNNSDHAPLCYGNYLTDVNNEDLQILLKSIRIIQQLVVESESFQQLDAKLYEKSVPGCENFIFDTESYWECAIHHLGVTLHHQTGTCKMGKVVNNKLRVKGVKRLRIADSSIIPITLSAHISAPTIMIGEKAAAIIKADNGIADNL